MSTAIRADQLRYAYRRQPVLRDLSFQVPSGSFTIVIGPNGSGKTTLLKILTGILPAAGGRVHLLDRPITAYPRKDLARTIALAPQLAAGDVPFTVEEVILMGRAPHQGLLALPRKQDLALVRQAMAFTDVTHLKSRRLDQLSGGELQRVIIARAFCQQSQILVLDEPTAALDPAHQVRIMNLLAELRRSARVTILMVSHDINLAAMYADRILVLHQGRAVGWGHPDEVLRADILENTYGARFAVDRSPVGPFPRVALYP